MDIAVLVEHILDKWFDESVSGNLSTSFDRYEEEMISRTGPAVLLSRKACLDAHNYAGIDERSPLIAKRAVISDINE